MEKEFKNNAERIDYLNRKHEEITNRQEGELLLDFDKALDEENVKLLKIKFMGKVFELPAEMPFSFSTFFMRYCLKKKGDKILFDIPENRIIEFINQMFGNEFVNCLNKTKDKRISSIFVFRKIVPQIMKKWGQDIDQSAIEEYQKKIVIRG
jgi:hypothetical protein